MGMLPDKSCSRNTASHPEQVVYLSPREGIAVRLQKTAVLRLRSTGHLRLQTLVAHRPRMPAALRLQILAALRLQMLAVLRLQILAPVCPKELLVCVPIHPRSGRRTSGGPVEG